MKCQISIVVITLLSTIRAQSFYGFGNTFFPGFTYPFNSFNFPGFTSPVQQQPQYVTSMQQQRLTRMAQQQQKMLAMNQFSKPQHTQQMTYGGFKWPKWPVYKPQYSYTKAIQSYTRPQPQFSNLPSTKLQATSTMNHIVKPVISSQYVPSKQNPLPSQSQLFKNYLSPQPVKYTQLYNYVPKTQTMKPIVVTQKNYIPFQGPKNTISYQSPFANYHYKSGLTLPSPSNTLTFKSPQPVFSYQQPKTSFTTQQPKNILTLQAPKSNLMLSTPTSQKTSASTQISVPIPSTEAKHTLPVMQATPKPQQTYSTFLGQSLVKNEPSASGISYANQLLGSTGSKTILTPVKSESERGPIHTIPAPNLSIGKPSMGYKPLAHHSPFYSYQPIKTPSYEVTEPSSEKGNPVMVQKYNPQQSNPTAPQKSVYNLMSNFSPSVPMYQSQPPAQTMSSQELYDLMNSVPPQQQLADAYNTPLQQQPQLQQHFMQQTMNANVPLQPFNAIIQPVYGSNSNIHDSNMMYKPDTKYTHKMMDHYMNQGNVMQPMFQMPKINKMEMFTAEAMANQHDSSNVHYNVIRNTKEGTITTNTTHNEHIKNGKQLMTMVDKDNNNSLPTSLPDVSNELTASKPVSASYFTEASGPEMSMSNYFAPLTNKEVEETLASIQEAARNIMKNKETTTRQNNFVPPNFQSYFGQTSHLNDAYYSFIPQSNNDFVPIVGSYETVAINDDTNEQNNIKSEAPIRIYVPDRYDDNESPSTHDISISASMNAQENDNQQNMVGSYTIDTQQNQVQNYAEYPQVNSNQENITTIDPVKNMEYTSTSVNSPTNTEDIFVFLQTNNTDPSLDILTKDWKTSIVIKKENNKETSGVSTQSSETSSDFGNRLRPKRNQ